MHSWWRSSVVKTLVSGRADLLRPVPDLRLTGDHSTCKTSAIGVSQG